MKMLPIFCMSIFFSTLPVQGMDPTSLCELRRTGKECCLLDLLPEESLFIANQSLENSIKILMKLSMLNTNFNTVWTVEKIGNLCKTYSDEDRAAMIYLLFAYNIRSCLYMPLAIAMHAGFGKDKDELNEYLLQRLVGREGFKCFVELLFKNKANPNIQTAENYPLLFKVKTIEEAQLFVNNNVDLHVISACYQSNWRINVLWCTVLEDYPLDLMKFYLDKHVDPRVLNNRGECLLHELVDKFCLIKDMDDYFKKFELLLGAIPDMINLLSSNGETPTGELMRLAKLDCERGYTLHSKEIYDKFIALFRERGGRTMLELPPWYKEGMPKI